MESAVSLNAETSQKLIADIRIPPQPNIVGDLLAEQENGDPNIQRMAALLSKDPGLSAAVLKTVNSAAFGLKAGITSIPQAVVLLGLTNVVSVVSSASLRQTMTDSIPGYDDFWSRSSDVALASAEVARIYTEASPDQAYALGLFYRCGIPLMLERFANYHTFMSSHEYQPPAEYKAWENIQFKTNHAVVGYFVARSWQLPLHLCQAIESNDNPRVLDDVDHRVARLVAVLRLAEHVVDNINGLPVSASWVVFRDALMAYFGLADDDLSALTADLADALNSC